MKRIGLPYLPDEIRNSYIKTPPALPAMTPAQLEHLRLLKAHLESLLETASKRTPEKWGYYWGWDMIYCGDNENRKMIADCVDRRTKEPSEKVRDDMAFIASCAGNAESGWKSTLAAVDHILTIVDFHTTRPTGLVQLTELEVAETFATFILAEWPIETLKP